MITDTTTEANGVGSKALLGPIRRKRTSPSLAPEYKAAYNRKLWARWGGKERFHRNANLKAKYGIGVEDYEKMLEAQRHGCAICRATQCASGGSLAVDHCHRTGKVRGLLCFKCNTAIGKFNDSAELLARAARYLEPKP